MPQRLLLRTLFAAAICAVPAASAQTRVLLCFPGGPGSTEQAQPVVDDFLAKLSALVGWSAARGTYTNDMAACKKAMTDGGADVVMVPLDVYLAERAAWKLHPAATLANKETASRYHLVAKAGTTLESLKGATVSTGSQSSDAFLSKVAFSGKVDTASDFTLKRERTALRAVKNLSKGKVQGALLNDVEQKALDGLPMAKELATVISGPALPGAIVASVGSEQPKLSQALLSVCQKHKETCEQMRVTGFQKVDVGQLAELIKQLQN